MNKQELRIAVAKDVLASLKFLKIKSGTWLIAHVGKRTMKKDSKEIARVAQKRCKVCAIGACFLSLVKLDNEFDFMENQYYSYAFDKRTVLQYDGTPLIDRLKDVFDKQQLVMIEAAFEEGEGGFGLDDFDNKENYEKASKFCPDNVSDKECLKMIMENIVKNKGEFKP